MILAKARSLRRILSPDAEYALRRLLNRLQPVRHRCRYDLVVHACVWKTASQWVRLVLSDPRIYRYSGLSVCLPNPYLKPDPAETRFPRRSLVPALVRSYPYFREIKKSGETFAFFVKRDPRDLIVSFYYSNRYSHPLNDEIARERRELAQMSEREGLLHTIGEFERFVDILTTWEAAAAADPRVRIVRYEDLTGANRLAAWAALFAEADIAVPGPLLERILATYAFERITGGRAQGIEAKADKYRKGIAGDWRNHFDGEMLDTFRRRYGDLPARLGYEP